MAEDISCIPGNDIPDNDDKLNSKMQLEADAFLNAIAGGADEDQADEAAFFASNPDGVVVDDNGEVLASGAKSKIKKGEKVEFIDDEATNEQEMPAHAGHDNLKDSTDKATVTSASSATSDDETPAESDEKEITDEEEIGDESLVTFDDLGLSPEVLEAVKLAGYEMPSPILCACFKKAVDASFAAVAERQKADPGVVSARAPRALFHGARRISGRKRPLEGIGADQDAHASFPPLAAGVIRIVSTGNTIISGRALQGRGEVKSESLDRKRPFGYTMREE